MLAVVLLHQAEALHHGIFDGAALEHAHELIVGILEAESAAGQRGYPARSARSAHVAQLRGQSRAQRGVLLGRKQSNGSREAFGQQQRDHDGEQREDHCSPNDNPLAQSNHEQQIKDGDVFTLHCGAPGLRHGRGIGVLIQIRLRSFSRHRFPAGFVSGAHPGKQQERALQIQLLQHFDGRGPQGELREDLGPIEQAAQCGRPQGFFGNDNGIARIDANSGELAAAPE